MYVRTRRLLGGHRQTLVGDRQKLVGHRRLLVERRRFLEGRRRLLVGHRRFLEGHQQAWQGHQPWALSQHQRQDADLPERQQIQAGKHRHQTVWGRIGVGQVLPDPMQEMWQVPSQIAKLEALHAAASLIELATGGYVCMYVVCVRKYVGLQYDKNITFMLLWINKLSSYMKYLIKLIQIHFLFIQIVILKVG